MAVESFYADLAARFKYKPPKFLSQTTQLKFCGFVISESQDEKGCLVRTMDCTKEVEKLLALAGVSIISTHQESEVTVSYARWLRDRLGLYSPGKLGINILPVDCRSNPVFRAHCPIRCSPCHFASRAIYIAKIQRKVHIKR